VYYDKLTKTAVDINPETAKSNSARFEKIIGGEFEQLQLTPSFKLNGKRTYLLDGKRVVKEGCVFQPLNHFKLINTPCINTRTGTIYGV